MTPQPPTYGIRIRHTDGHYRIRVYDYTCLSHRWIKHDLVDPKTQLPVTYGALRLAAMQLEMILENETLHGLAIPDTLEAYPLDQDPLESFRVKVSPEAYRLLADTATGKVIKLAELPLVLANLAKSLVNRELLKVPLIGTLKTCSLVRVSYRNEQECIKITATGRRYWANRLVECA
jgi:hypothetical protein